MEIMDSCKLRGLKRAKFRGDHAAGWLSGIAASLLFATGLYGQAATYAYKGNNFTTVGIITCSAEPPCPQPYTVANSITGHITLNAPIPPNSAILENFGGANVSSFSFSDGVNTWNSSNSAVTSFLANTDSKGNIIEWYLSLVGTSGALAAPGAALYTCGPELSGCGGAMDSVNVQILGLGYQDYVGAGNQGEPGSWAQLSVPPSGCPVSFNVVPYPGPPYSTDGERISMNATFTPTDMQGNVMTLAAAGAACGFVSP